MRNTFVSCAAERDTGGVFSFRAVYDGYRACRRRKRGTANAQRYERRLLDHLVDTAEALQRRDYAPSRSLCFVARQPKAREIHAADFSDRVVHHVLVPRLEALFEPVFIDDLYSNRKGKGTHAAVERLGAFMRSVSDNGKRPAWFLQLDVRNFFNRIDQALLFRLVNRRLKKAVDGALIDAAEARDLSWLTHLLLKQDFKHETLYRCTPQELDRVPPYKRLTEAPPGKGLPIGNLTSQFYANVYLNELDQFVKHGLKCRHYLRYVDDFVLVHESPAQLHDWERRIEAFLAERLMLELKPDRRLRPVTDGSDFLGYIVRPRYRLVRRRVVGNLRERLAPFERVAVTATSLRLQAAARDRLRAVLASYLGHFAHADAHRLVRRLFAVRPWLGVLFDWVAGALGPRWQPPSVTSLRSQVAYFRQAFEPALVLVQLGNRVAAFEADLRQALAVAPWLERWSQMRAETRHGLGEGRSWPLSHLKGLGQSLRRAGQPYCFIAEEGWLPGGMKRRVLRYLFVGPNAPLLLGPAGPGGAVGAPSSTP
ncbi:reverse transcriptase domain-containing protein [uncultured Thiocystis sp.]|jgi:hypothetical protein|uniref:reverse transcriptase/maturase family protein n=1 Tax=uncultured Thiocystis sp. TaxID=1202134 RepID=UPI0025E8949F|nr:reverse transcriptase domain-containing protein [uncultured Thiocystis sp.]